MKSFYKELDLCSFPWEKRHQTSLKALEILVKFAFESSYTIFDILVRRTTGLIY